MTMTRKLLDTTFLVHYWAGTPAVANYLDEQADSTEFVTTTINLKEIAVGRKLQGEFDPFEIRSTFDWIDIVSFDADHALIAGELEATLRRGDDHNQDKINSLAADLLIAGVARDLDIPVVTRNVDDFELFDGVEVERY